ncbi:hypothetical protein RND71_025490 [Anisodus tanguticus]|uniref:Cytochrome P450 n=1 Tax=Anisodus tanguticus TaxID=243964 RepID=A0AAE1RQ41_9SOLA|nr:hypothetical protein RND71_025490 [Anisodus tanguticus]
MQIEIPIKIQSFSKFLFEDTPKEKIPLAPPVNFGWPIIGETIQFLKALHYGLVHEFVQEKSKKYNSNVFKTSLLGQKVAIFSRPSANKFIFTRGNKFLTYWRPNSAKKLFLSTSFVPIEHDTKRAQNVMSYFLNSQNVETLISTMDSMSHLHLQNLWKGKDEARVYDLVKLFTFSLSIRVFMGIEDSDKILNLYEKFNIFTRGLLIVDIKFPGTTFCKAMRAGNELRKEMKAIIEERRAELLENPNLSKIYLSFGATQKNGEYFPNPTKFDPCRFEGNGLVPYTLVPFGEGHKMCPGKEFARILILVFLHHVLQNFRWEAKAPSEKILHQYKELSVNVVRLSIWKDGDALPFTHIIINE